MAERRSKALAERLAAWPLGQSLGDVLFSARVSLFVGLAMNVLHIVLELAMGLYARSVWRFSLAGYYTLLAAMRYLLLRRSKAGRGQMETELRKYRACGILLLVLHQALLGMVAFMVWEGRGFRYPGYLIYGVAAYAFYAVISAAIRLRKARRYSSPVLSATRAVRMAAALVSILALQTALIDAFAQPGQELFRAVMTAAVGDGVCLVIIVMAVVMIVKSTRALRALRSRQNGGEQA